MFFTVFVSDWGLAEAESLLSAFATGCALFCSVAVGVAWLSTSFVLSCLLAVAGFVFCCVCSVLFAAWFASTSSALTLLVQVAPSQRLKMADAQTNTHLLPL